MDFYVLGVPAEREQLKSYPSLNINLKHEI